MIEPKARARLPVGGRGRSNLKTRTAVLKDPRYDFEWDPPKAERNLRRHGVTFEESATAFLDPLALSLPDVDHSDDEERWITQGLTERGKLTVVVHTFREVSDNRAVVRIISARRSTKRERQLYEAGH